MSEVVQTKRCSGCGEVKAFSAFFKNKNTKDGLQTYCKACIRGYKQQWRKNPEVRQKDRDYQRKRYAADPERFRNEARQRHATDPEPHREAARRWREQHREDHLASLKRYRESHRDLMHESTKRWKKANPEKAKESTKQWWKKNRERGYALLKKREARKKAAPGVFTGEEIKQQYARQEGKCAWCGAELNGRYDIDHVIALTRGGSNWAWNLACACKNCNNSKKAKLPFIEWQPPNPLAGFTREKIEELITRHGNPRQLPLF